MSYYTAKFKNGEAEDVEIDFEADSLLEATKSAEDYIKKHPLLTLVEISESIDF